MGGSGSPRCLVSAVSGASGRRPAPSRSPLARGAAAGDSAECGLGRGVILKLYKKYKTKARKYADVDFA
ncbi:hypothetical protein STEG23_002523, partial [Scotinomys teguina]